MAGRSDAVERTVERRGAAVEALRQGLDVLADGKVAHAPLSQMTIDIPEQEIEQRLSQLLATWTLGAETAHDQDGVQIDELQPTVPAVGDTLLAVKNGPASLRDEVAIELVGTASSCAPCAASDPSIARARTGPPCPAGQECRLVLGRPHASHVRHRPWNSAMNPRRFSWAAAGRRRRRHGRMLADRDHPWPRHQSDPISPRSSPVSPVGKR